MTTLAVGFAHQLRRMRGHPDWFLALFTAPLMTAVLVSLLRHGGRDDVVAYGVLAPALIALWQMGLQTAGELVATERENGSLEALVAAPVSLTALVVGRVAAVTAVSLLALAESWTVGRLLTGRWVSVEHPVLLVATVAVSAAAMAGTSTLMAAVFVLARSARTFQNSLSFPFYLLGGVVVPVALLPDWAQVPARAVFLSWTSDLLRDCLAPAPVRDVAARLLVVAALGAAGLWLGHRALTRTVTRLRTTGTATHA